MQPLQSASPVQAVMCIVWLLRHPIILGAIRASLDSTIIIAYLSARFKVLSEQPKYVLNPFRKNMNTSYINFQYG